MRFTRQAHRCKYTSAIRFDVAFQVRQRTAHAYKIIDQDVLAASLHLASKLGLACKSRKPVSTCMRDHVNLCHTKVMWPAERFTDLHRKVFGNGINTFPLIGVGAYQGRRAPAQQSCQINVLLPYFCVRLLALPLQHQCSRGRLAGLGAVST